MRIVGVFLVLAGIVIAIPAFELIVEAWRAPAAARSAVWIAGYEWTYRQACVLFLAPATILIALGVVAATIRRTPS